MVESGFAQLHSRKAEDFWAIQCADDKCAHFGVFDSHGPHGGKEAGQIAAATLPEKLLSLNGNAGGHDAFPLAAVSDEFWEMDKHLGESGVMSGTTATVLLVSTKENGVDASAAPTLCCTLLWVGDSTALCVDMASEKAAPLIRSSTNHVPSNPKEVERCRTEWQVRRMVQQTSYSKRLEAEAEGDDALGSEHSFNILRDKGESFYAKHKALTTAQDRSK